MLWRSLNTPSSLRLADTVLSTTCSENEARYSTVLHTLESFPNAIQSTFTYFGNQVLAYLVCYALMSSCPLVKLVTLIIATEMLSLHYVIRAPTPPGLSNPCELLP